MKMRRQGDDCVDVQKLFCQTASMQIGVIPENEIYSDEVQKGDGVEGGRVSKFQCNSSLASFEY